MTSAQTPTQPSRHRHHPHLLRSAAAIVAAADRILQTMEPAPPPDDRDAVTPAIGRGTNDRMQLWKHCANAGCGRAGRCRGLPHRCLERLAPRLTTAGLVAARRWPTRRAAAD